MTDGLVLVIEDEDAIREMVRVTLESASFEVLEAVDAEQAEMILADHCPGLILMDWMLPGISGIELTRRIKRDDVLKEIPIIMLTAKGEENSKVMGLEAGVDDYVTKPFSTRELIARIRAVMRRSGVSQGESLEIGDGLKLDPSRHRVTANGASLEIGPTEFRLLQFFMSHPERVYSRSQLLDQVWGRNVYIEERTVDVHIRRLRKALEPSGFDALVQTVRGVGYRFSVQN
ncbi:MAG: phosphate regulon transcriptional regulatory protein PhoB [Gammaproteobacteria bacterium RIFOXYA12_FULL_61_12]|nr:MAG: phosphate regulon transcriptional regulatory protein PhoB [Gammaproteobacteria bacterium RIFOXYD12_FULL_61_37]OGT93657.1 MAG: phosphate regulon transcriptional regulatory protein PhoB [Gammaproteobacteria bacterium RIFOXYA12_FULL_61_12]